MTPAHQRTAPVQSSLQFQSSKSERTEAENRATVSHTHLSALMPLKSGIYLPVPGLPGMPVRRERERETRG
ncbi:hypothetical protein AMECASPLE_004367 [Ameca splendens]|uniref:Uncharacterized protein n=1 Tax=Ameca splendens TaxID=208324 RepID=A0ABV0ZW79_9TELE